MLGAQAQAATFTQTLNYNASNQSLWGPGGGTADFGYAQNIGFEIPLGLGNVNVGYSVGASSGTVSAGFDGKMTVGYMDSLAAPGSTTLSLAYEGKDFGIEFVDPPGCTGILCIPIFPVLTPAGGSLTSNLGAHAQLTSSVGNIGPDFTLEIDDNFLPELGTVVNNTTTATAAELPVIDVLVAAAGVQLDVTQNSSFVANSVDGNLLYSLQGSGIFNSTSFSLGDAGLNIDVDLTESGVWDFWFEDQMLSNAYSTSFDLDLGLFASTEVGCGFLLLESCSSSTTLASLPFLSVSPFALEFNKISNLNGFSIQVAGIPSAVPVPAAVWLFSTAMIGLVGFSKRRKAA